MSDMRGEWWYGLQSEPLTQRWQFLHNMYIILVQDSIKTVNRFRWIKAAEKDLFFFLSLFEVWIKIPVVFLPSFNFPPLISMSIKSLLKAAQHYHWLFLFCFCFLTCLHSIHSVCSHASGWGSRFHVKSLLSCDRLSFFPFKTASI